MNDDRNDYFCVRHGLPYDAFEGCWQCTTDARNREDEKRRATNESEATIARLTRELAAARALLPSEDELDTAIDACAEAAERVCWDPRRFDVAREWLARLEAARVEGEGKP